jgi:hypothetical protein
MQQGQNRLPVILYHRPLLYNNIESALKLRQQLPIGHVPQANVIF